MPCHRVAASKSDLGARRAQIPLQKDLHPSTSGRDAQSVEQAVAIEVGYAMSLGVIKLRWTEASVCLLEVDFASSDEIVEAVAVDVREDQSRRTSSIILSEHCRRTEASVTYARIDQDIAVAGSPNEINVLVFAVSNFGARIRRGSLPLGRLAGPQ